MTTTRTAKKTEPEAGHTPEELRVASEVHTLAQLTYRHLAASHPWIPMPPALFTGVEPLAPPMHTAPWAGGPAGPVPATWYR